MTAQREAYRLYPPSVAGPAGGGEVETQASVFFAVSRFELVGLYLSKTAQVAHLREGPERPSDTDQERLGRFLRHASDCARQAGSFLPVVAVVEVEPERAAEIATWAGDQDWHRGDFALVAAAADGKKGASEVAAEHVERHLLPFDAEPFDFRSLEALDQERYTARVEEQLELREKLSAAHRTLVQQLHAALTRRTTVQAAADSWAESQLSIIRAEMQEGEKQADQPPGPAERSRKRAAAASKGKKR